MSPVAAAQQFFIAARALQACENDMLDPATGCKECIEGYTTSTHSSELDGSTTCFVSVTGYAYASAVVLGVVFLVCVLAAFRKDIAAMLGRGDANTTTTEESLSSVSTGEFFSISRKKIGGTTAVTPAVTTLSTEEKIGASPTATAVPEDDQWTDAMTDRTISPFSSENSNHTVGHITLCSTVLEHSELDPAVV